jgi:hypothetical protein
MAVFEHGRVKFHIFNYSPGVTNLYIGSPKMKSFRILILFICFTCTTLSARPVDLNEAEIVAETRIELDNRTEAFAVAGYLALEGGNGDLLLAHVFELDPVGYVIVPADNTLPPVIAYSYTDNCICDGDESSILLDMVRMDIDLRLSAQDEVSPNLVQANRVLWDEYISGRIALPDRQFQQWPEAGSTPTGGWLNENWAQGAPYNAYCPVDLIAGSRSVAGCPAVAMASILNFAEETNGTRFDETDDYYHNYHEFYWIDDDHAAHDFPSWSELNVLMDSLESHYSSQHITLDDKAALVYACGAACKQVYTASVSGTFGVNQAYNAYLRFDFTGCSLLYASSDSLYDRLSENMMNAIPAHLAVVDAASQYGHNLVIDGYNTDDFYHLNFGWSGSTNGWYQFPLSGMPYSMNIIEGIILDIGDGPQSVEGDTPYDGEQVLILSRPANPVSGYLLIGISVMERCNVNVSVYSISGHLITTVADSEYGTGNFQLCWNTDDIPNGVYILAASGPWGLETARFTVLQ